MAFKTPTFFADERRFNLTPITNEPADLIKAKIKLCYELEEKMQDIAAEYKGLVSKMAFKNIAGDTWQMTMSDFNIPGKCTFDGVDIPYQKTFLVSSRRR